MEASALAKGRRQRGLRLGPPGSASPPWRPSALTTRAPPASAPQRSCVSPRAGAAYNGPHRRRSGRGTHMPDGEEDEGGAKDQRQHVAESGEGESHGWESPRHRPGGSWRATGENSDSRNPRGASDEATGPHTQPQRRDGQGAGTDGRTAAAPLTAAPVAQPNPSRPPQRRQRLVLPARALRCPLPAEARRWAAPPAGRPRGAGPLRGGGGGGAGGSRCHGRRCLTGGPVTTA